MANVDISIKAEGISALYSELKDIETLQLKVGEDMAKLLFEQVRLAEKSRSLLLAVERILK